MDCTNARELIREHVRGTLEPGCASELEGHVEGREACRHEVEAERLLDAALRERLPRTEAPDSLRRRVASIVAPTPDAAGNRPSPRVPGWLVAVAAVLVAVLGFLGGRFIQHRNPSEVSLVDELVSDHLRVLASAHPLDVESTDSHQVKPWFEGRIDFAPVVPGDREGLRLLGGTIGYVTDRKAAVVSYAVRRHRLTLIAFPIQGGDFPGQNTPPGQAPAVQSRRGFEVATWTAGDLAYALVGDIPREELGRLAGELAAETRR